MLIIKKKYIHQEQMCHCHSGKSCKLEVLNSKKALEFLVSLNIILLRADYIFSGKLSHFFLMEIQYFKNICLQGTCFNFSHFQKCYCNLSSKVSLKAGKADRNKSFFAIYYSTNIYNIGKVRKLSGNFSLNFTTKCYEILK